MSTNVVIASTGPKNSSTGPNDLQAGEQRRQKAPSAGKPETAVRLSLSLVEYRASSWSRSGLKRLFDIASVLLALPLLLPVFLILGLAVRITSRGPVLFKQKRMGMNRRNFTILKFRTMEHLESGARCKVTTAGNQSFTVVGPFLRRWKLDELPQLLNVLIGNMSLVGPRPKLPEHHMGELKCRPGITGAATIAFAREEHILAQLPNHHLDGFYHEIILPTKFRLDREYMARATFMSDLKLILDTILRRWDSETICSALAVDSSVIQSIGTKTKALSPMTMAKGMADIADESMASGD